MKKLFVFIMVITALSLVQAQEGDIVASIQQCFPDYVCAEWGICEGFLQTRVCEDRQCGVRDVREIRFCGLEATECNPDVLCEEWSECAFTEELDKIFVGEISFGGFRTRHCTDLNRCVEDFIEESLCQDTSKIQLSVIEECNEEFLVAANLDTNGRVVKISLDTLKNGRLDIIASQSKTAYCPSCYNGIEDSDEQRTDCGGSCAPCSRINFAIFPVELVELIFWALASFFILLALSQFKLNFRFKDTNFS